MVQTLNKINRHSNYDENGKKEEHMKAPDDFLLPGSVGALAPAIILLIHYGLSKLKGSLNQQPVYLMTMETLLLLANSTCRDTF